jgi:hypothetical protein
VTTVVVVAVGVVVAFVVADVGVVDVVEAGTAVAKLVAAMSKLQETPEISKILIVTAIILCIF